jgi:hypothetical protein
MYVLCNNLARIKTQKIYRTKNRDDKNDKIFKTLLRTCHCWNHDSKINKRTNVKMQEKFEKLTTAH